MPNFDSFNQWHKRVFIYFDYIHAISLKGHLELPNRIYMRRTWAKQFYYFVLLQLYIHTDVLTLPPVKWKHIPIHISFYPAQCLNSFLSVRWSTLGLYSLNGKTSYRQISWSLEAARMDLIMIVSLRNLTGISAALLPRCLSNFR